MQTTRSPRLAVALDVSDTAAVRSWLERLPDEVTWYKVGLELFCAEGPAVLDPLRDRGKKVFLDLKLHDIPRTAARAVSSMARHGVHLATVHAAGGRAMMAAAAEEAGDQLDLVAVTTLTSLDAADFRDLGLTRSVEDQALALADLAVGAGIDGVVTSALEAERLRGHLGPGPLLVTPGIRLPGGDVGDQKRVATPQLAVAAGSSLLVVGRPILEAEDPAEAAHQMLQAMQGCGAAACSRRPTTTG